jgi:hypothetical protein
MTIRDGFQSFDFQMHFELPKPLTFASQDEALRWLKELASRRPESLVRFREYLARLSGDPETSRITDHDATVRMAELLYTRKVMIVVRKESSGGKGGAPKTAAPAAAFPLSERLPRAASVTSKPAPVIDPPTFEPRVDAVTQAAALVAAAAEGQPFCTECQKPRTTAAGTSA